jgi:cell wall-associated protease
MRTLLITTLLILATKTALAQSLFPRQWALNNNGQSLYRETGELTRERVIGINGEDINWMRPLEVMEFAQAQNLTLHQGPVVVAVIDTGLDLDHPAFKDRLWFNEALCGELSVDERASQPCHGWNFLDGNADLSDDNGHGTHIAGLIAANETTSSTRGATPEGVVIMPLRAIGDGIQGFTYKNRLITDIIADAISFAVQNGAHIINLSLGWPEIIHIPKIDFALKRAQELGILVVAATGNNNKDIPTYPCSYSGVVCVGAHDHQGAVAEFSNFSGKVDLVAPGEDIVSTHPRNLESRLLRTQGYELKRGSSQAAPYVVAAAATLKLLYPEITVGELRARLYSSARPVHGKPVKFGALDMRKAITHKPELFVRPDFKSVLEVKINAQGRFSIDLPIRNELKDAARDLEVFVSIPSQAVELETTHFTIDRIPGEGQRLLRLQGSISDFTADTDTFLKVSIQAPEFEQSTQTNLIFTQVIDLDHPSIITQALSGVHPDQVSFFNGPQKVSRVRRMLLADRTQNAHAWFYQNPTLQTPNQTVVSVVHVTKDSSALIELKLGERVQQVLGLFNIDINFDGDNNYIVYSMDSNRQNLILHLFTSAGELVSSLPARWTFPISAFEGLPLRPAGEDFSWLKVKTDSWGELLVPSFRRRWVIPEEDNIPDLLDRINPVSQDRLFYLLPIKNDDDEVELTIRTLEGYDFFTKLDSKIHRRFNEQVSLSRPFEQSSLERRRGEVTALLQIGRESTLRNYKITFKGPNDFALLPFYSGVHQLQGNLIQRILDPATQGPSNALGLMALVSREHARLVSFDPEGQLQERHFIQNPTWADPFFMFLGGAKTAEGEVLFLESRYHLMAYHPDHGVSKLPVNRDSSFPGSNFSEMFALQFVETSSGELTPALSVNATQVYGERLYVMAFLEGKLQRPIELSFALPTNCLALNGERSPDGSTIALLCRDRSAPLLEQMSIKLIPLRLGTR